MIVLFDADGVVQTSRPVAAFLTDRFAWNDDEAAAFLDDLWQRVSDAGCVVGAADALMPFAAALARAGADVDAAAFYDDMLRSCVVPDADVLALVDELRAEGNVCGLATNQDNVAAAFMLDALGYRDRFDRLYVSCALGVRKPHPEFFAAVLRDLAADASGVVFVDDSQANVDAATAAGMQGILVKPGDSVRQLLANAIAARTDAPP